jgi:hypothetical protein
MLRISLPQHMLECFLGSVGGQSHALVNMISAPHSSQRSRSPVW